MKAKSPSADYSYVLFVTLVVALSSACTTPGPTKEMSLEKAKQITVSMSDRTAFVPPPRRIDDITAILNQPGEFNRELTEKFVARANATPPATEDKIALYRFYKMRGRAAYELGNPVQALEDLRTAFRLAEEAGTKDRELALWLSLPERDTGNLKRALELLESQLPAPGLPGLYGNLVETYCGVGRVEDAIKIRDQALSHGRWSQDPWWEISLTLMEFKILSSQGKAAQAEPFLRKHVQLYERTARELFPGGVISRHHWLAGNLLNQQRLIEAEVEARKALSESIAHAGKDSIMTAWCIDLLAGILRSQGRLQEAEQLCSIAVDMLNRLEIPGTFPVTRSVRRTLANIRFAKGDFFSAMNLYEQVRESLGDQRLYENMVTRNPDLVLALIMTGRPQEALEIADAVYHRSMEIYGDKAGWTKGWQTIRGMAHFRLKNLKEALKDFSEGMEGWLSNVSRFRDYSRIKRFRMILDDYIHLLNKIRDTPWEREMGLDAGFESFRMSEASRSQSVQWALSASSARATVDDPETADLMRREQDCAQQMAAIEAAMQELAAAPSDQQDPKLLRNLRQQLDTLRNAREAILTEIEKRAPKYAEIVRPRQASLSKVQGVLRPGEALISIYATDDGTYVWSIPYKGQPRFASVPLNKKDLQEMVTALRKSLDPKPLKLNDIPDFDVNLAHRLYRQLLEPVEEGWKGASDLLVTVNEALGQIPLGTLVTAPAGLGREKGELFSEYRKVPWLIRKASITMLPSASSLIILRTLQSTAGLKRFTFAGFGDPVFNPKHVGAPRETRQERSLTVASKGNVEVKMRGIRLISKGDLDNRWILSCRLESLSSLPDTADEIRIIGTAVGADMTQDIFLGKQASEHQVKTMNLADRRIIAFATHGLVPGDLDGLDQPAIALSSPAATLEEEDGLLTIGEIMKLRLNADWVVLSACNTAAADGAGAEALSGLVRAFFYAGTRSVLASMYPVETTSARKLVTTTFKYQMEDPAVSRARVLQKSMLDVMTGSGLVDPATGQIVCSYAHPLFWAPFILVGDTGGHSE